MKTTRKILAIACLTLGASLAATASAQHAGHHPAATAGQAKTMTDMAEAEVRRVDKAGGKVTLRHGELKQLDMPPMTMVFEVKDKAMLESIKAGDKVKFKAMDDNGKLFVTEMRPAS
jgi:Cu(I)/Ag(I) efflux system periplasmic protein CusF